VEPAAGQQAGFASSQVKPPAASGQAALEAPAAPASRLAAQRNYLGGGGDKAALLGPQGTPLSAVVRDLLAGVVRVRFLDLTAGQRILAETQNLSAGADPVLHLWSLARRQEVAMNDDGGEGLGARLDHRATEAGRFALILRGYATGDGGTCDVTVNGALDARSTPFGGSSLKVAAGRRLHTVRLNDGQQQGLWPPPARAARDTVLLLLDPSTGALRGLDDDSGVELSALLMTGTSDAVAMVGALGAGEDGAARLVVNDAPAKDSDGDGLGDGLEQRLGTCAAAAGKAGAVACAGLPTAQDSDADGLSDAEEVLGQEDTDFPQLYPRWGADPRHKDLFVEIDLAHWTDTKRTPPVKRFGRTLSPADAHLAAGTYAALTTMNNPDGKDGIALHLDLGRACGTRPSGIDHVCGDLCAWGQDGKRRCGQSRYGGPQTDRRAGLGSGRRNRFHLAVSDCLVAGSAPIYADTLEFDCDRFSAMVHELGHNLGLARHYGTVKTGGGNCKPNYPSLMNYAYSDRFDGTREPRFSDGSLLGAGDLDPRDIDELTPFGGKTARVGWLAARPFFYTLRNCASPSTGCQVDWNRDGKLDGSVAAHLSPMPGYGWICEGAHGNALGSENIPGQKIHGGVAAADMPRRSGDGPAGEALQVIAPVTERGETRLQLTWTAAATGGWSAWTDLGTPALAAGTQPAAVVLGSGASRTLHLTACRAGASPILHATMDASGNLGTMSPVPGQPAGLETTDVALARWGTDLLLVARDAAPGGGDMLYITRYTAGAGWSGSFTRLTSGTAPLRSTVTPALAEAPGNRLYLVTGDPAPLPGSGPTGRLHLHSYTGSAALPTRFADEELAGLRFEDDVPSKEHVLWARPALRFVPHLDGRGNALSGGRGYLALWWTRGSRTRYLWTWGRLDQQTAAFTLGRWHHYEAFGYTDSIAAASPALALRGGKKLSALLAQGDFAPRLVRHVPNADGVPHEQHIFRDHDDRAVLRGGLCASLNWDCPGRCKRLTDPCQKTAAATRSPPEVVRCRLPRWTAPWGEP